MAPATSGLTTASRPRSTSRSSCGKVFPDHWSFMLGEIALYSFIILLLSGTFLAVWFKPSMVEVVYDGSYLPLNGVKMSEAYASTLDISFDIRGGLLMRQIHHWAALFFVAAISVHLLRVFFTGAFRKPRETQLDHRRRAADPGAARRFRRLLAARRPALWHRPPDRPGHHALHPCRRHLPVLLRVRRGVPRHRLHPAPLYRARASGSRASFWP